MNTSRRGARLVLLAAMLAMLVVCATLPVWAATYYVSPTGSDSNDGSAPDDAHAWATITNGETKAGFTLSPGDVIEVGAGQYTIFSPLVITHSGTAGHPITYHTKGARIDYDPSAPVAQVFTIDAANYVVMDGFEFGFCGDGIKLLNNASNIEMRNLNFHITFTYVPGAYAFINMGDGGAANVNANCFIHNNLFRDNQWWKQTKGVYAAYDTGLRIDNNVFDGAYWGIEADYCTDTIQNNVFVNCPAYTIAAWPTKADNVADHNLYWAGNTPGCTTNDNGYVTHGAGEIYANPLFNGGSPVWPDYSNPFDYTLIDTSPCVNKGIDVGLPFIGAAPDIGAFESSIVGGKITGTVRDSASGLPIAGATVTLVGTGLSQTTQADGAYRFTDLSGPCSVKASCPGAADQQVTVTVEGSNAYTQDFQMVFTVTTYYVKATGDDTKDGKSLANAWRTIGHGDSAGILVPGDKVLVEPGTYGPVSLTKKSGLNVRPIVYAADKPQTPDAYQADGTGPVIAGANAGENGISIVGALGDIVIDGLEIKNVGVGVNVLGADDITVRNCYIHNTKSDDIFSGSGASIAASGGTDVTNNLLVEKNVLTSTLYGVLVNNPTAGLKVYNNTFDGGMIALYELSGDAGAAIEFVNNIVANMTDGGINTTNSTVNNSYNLYDLNTPAPPSGTEEVTADPLFVGGTAPACYKLKVAAAPVSPAAESGTIIGLPFKGVRPDRGAYESNYTYPGTVYHVKLADQGGNDDNDGLTPATAWATISNGDAKRRLLPNDTVLVEPGIYGAVELANCSGGELSPITYKANGQGVYITRPGWYGVWFHNTVSHITFDGFDVFGCFVGVCVGGANYITVQNCDIHDSANDYQYDRLLVQTSDGSNPTMGLMIRNNVFRNIDLYSTLGYDAPWGPAIEIEGRTIDAKIVNNTFEQCETAVRFNGWAGGPDQSLVVRNNICSSGRGMFSVENTLQVPVVDHNLGFNIVYGNYPGSIDGDPMFTFETNEYYGLDLLNFSPAIDAGVVAYPGQTFQGNAPDLGAFESPYTRPAFPTIASLRDVKKAANDTAVGTDVLVVTGVFGNSFYLEQTDRACGIRVDRNPAGVWITGALEVGQKVQVAGKVKTDASTEKYILADQIVNVGTGSAAPVMTTNKSLNAVGLSTIGLLVTTTGKVTASAADSFVIDDGSGIGVKVLSNAAPAVNAYLTVVGASSCWKDGSVVKPLIRMTASTTVSPAP